MAGDFRSEVHELALAAGVAKDWVDAWGNPQQVSDETLVAVLEALLDRQLVTEGDVGDARRQVAATFETFPSVVVAWDGNLQLPLADAPARIELEDGSELIVDAGGAEGVTGIPIGYHRLVVNQAGRERSAHVFSAPLQAAPLPHGLAGLMAPTYSLRSDRDQGIGGLADLRLLSELGHDAGLDVVGTLPLLASLPGEPSPYAPASRRAWNDTFVDLSRLPGWRDGHVGPVSGDLVDYPEVEAAVRSTITEYVSHVASSPSLTERVSEFIATRPDLADFSAFRATVDSFGRDWRRWPGGASGTSDDVTYHRTVQWLMHEQIRDLGDDLASRGQVLYLDLPIGCHADGFEIWQNPGHYAPASLGAPPDTLFVGGQDWGLPATIPAAASADGHLAFRLALRHHLSVSGLMRMDHVMGLHRSWWVPSGLQASEGAYVQQPTDELFATICIESARSGTPVVGENLGTVPPEIGARLARHRLAGMAVGPDGSRTAQATDLLALSSHDTPSFISWWEGDDIDDMLDLDVFDDRRASTERDQRAAVRDHLKDRYATTDPNAVLDGLHADMAASDAAVSLMYLDDLLGERRRQNVPGTYRERPNWRLRYRTSVAEMRSDDAFMRRLGLGSRRAPGR